MFATNCWVIAPGEGQECIVVDPGMPDISQEIENLILSHQLKPVAALLTHGHLDHTFSVKPLSDGYEIPTYIHSQDRAALTDPSRLHSSHIMEMVASFHFEEPKKVESLKNGQILEILNLKIETIFAPGHTAGSLMFKINEEFLLSGDVLFAGSIGRTDLPTGSWEEMQKTLTTKILPLSDDLRVLTGHGKETTIKIERKNNPYLKELIS